MSFGRGAEARPMMRTDILTKPRDGGLRPAPVYTSIFNYYLQEVEKPPPLTRTKFSNCRHCPKSVLFACTIYRNNRFCPMRPGSLIIGLI